jgi:hypothetical protein
MALLFGYKFKISYGLGKMNSLETYRNVLTDVQMEELIASAEKEFIISNAYYKITNINGNGDNLSIEISVYRDESKVNCISKMNYEFIPELNSPYNFLKQGYKYLKTLPEFSEAIDVLE